ncbi:hypothetical protein K144316041_p20190 (plasmid) [Clostridium tetani]|uniref:hypothetical protein n=1 Tax=Clostridium tetani TaxID=1513 RepID=UPI002953DAE1|nr:hypothetical protein [Clostridium tetani]BDR74180.1 hypothetical protein K144316041_p20190 [Clostridium tetani]
MSTEKITVTCTNCNAKETRSQGQRFDKFYKCTHFKGDAGLYRRLGHYPLCRECVRKLSSNGEGQINVDKFKKVLKSFNRPFIRRLYQKALLSKKDTIGQYFTSLGNRKYQPMTWKDSNELKDEKPSKIETLKEEIEIVDEVIEGEENIIPKSNFKVTEDMVAFWGKRDKVEDYEFLENEYGNLTTRFENDSYSQEMLFQEIALQRLDIRRKRENGDNVDKELKTLQDLLGSANIKPVQETGANASEQKSFGVLIKKWENERPIPKADPKWEDVDGIKDYIDTWFLGHLCKMMGVKNEFSKKYEEALKKYSVKLENDFDDEDSQDVVEDGGI